VLSFDVLGSFWGVAHSRRNGKNSKDLKHMISDSPVIETPVPCDPSSSQAHLTRIFLI
jgi:hypothetical protein